MFGVNRGTRERIDLSNLERGHLEYTSIMSGYQLRQGHLVRRKVRRTLNVGLVLRVVFVVGLLTGSADNPDINLVFFLHSLHKLVKSVSEYPTFWLGIGYFFYMFIAAVGTRKN